MAVIPEIGQLRETEMSLPSQSAGETARLDALKKIEFKSATAEIELLIRNQAVHLSISDDTQEIFGTAFDPNCDGGTLHIGPAIVKCSPSAATTHRLRLFLDGSVVECFLDDQVAWTSRTYRAAKSNLRIQIPREDLGAVQSLRIWPLRPISRDRLTT